VWPNPFQASQAVGGTLKAGCLPAGARAFIHTVSGERVAEMVVRGDRATWDGLTGRGTPASGGTYYVLVKTGTVVLHRAKVVLLQ
jgi:hypothetical protein